MWWSRLEWVRQEMRCLVTAVVRKALESRGKAPRVGTPLLAVAATPRVMLERKCWVMKGECAAGKPWSQGGAQQLGDRGGDGRAANPLYARAPAGQEGGEPAQAARPGADGGGTRKEEGVLDRLLQDGKPGKEGRVAEEGAWGDGEREEVAGRVVGGSCHTPRLPFSGCRDGEGGMVLVPRCAHGWCCELAILSEAELQLRACGRCWAVGYCSTECQRADWAAGHMGACVRAAARQ